MRDSAWLALWFAALGLTAPWLVACGGGESALVVNLRTDLRPGQELTAVQTEVVDAAGARHTDTIVLSPSADTLGGVRVADFEVARGRAEVRVTLIGLDGRPLIDRGTIAQVSDATSVLLVINSDCLGVLCGGETPECQGGVCVAVECGPENPEACAPDAVCQDDTDCMAPSAPCARAVCREAFCVSVADDAMCAASEFCSVAQGCLPSPLDDAGAPDAGGPDAGPIDAGPDNGAGDDAGMPDAGPGGCPLTPDAILALPTNSSLPPGWTCASCGDTSILRDRFPRASDVAGGTGGAERHSHMFMTGAAAPNTADVTRVLATGPSPASVAELGHTHAAVSGVSDPTPHLPPYVNVLFVRPDATTLAVPASAVLLFDADVPPGLVLADPLNEYMRGAGGPGGGGSSAHFDLVEGAFGPTTNLASSVDLLTSCLPAGAGHTHEFVWTVEAQNRPPTVDLIHAFSTMPLAQVPRGALVMFLGPPPPGWTIASGPGSALHHRFLRTASVADLTGTGADMHQASVTRRTEPGRSEAPAEGNAPACNDSGHTARSADEHDHEVMLELAPATSLPPYVDVIVARCL